MPKKIAIIENQETQFHNIRELFLEAKYSVIPSIKEYPSFIDAVKIYLNPRYLAEARHEAFNEIIKNITGADILVIDHRLCGNSKGQDGIDLAEAILLNQRKEKLFLPLVIFYSRSPRGVQDIKDRLQQFKDTLENYREDIHWTWIEKGYVDVYGDETKYFQKWVIENGIEEMILQNGPFNEKKERDHLVQKITDCFSQICAPDLEPASNSSQKAFYDILRVIQKEMQCADIERLEILYDLVSKHKVTEVGINTTNLTDLTQKLNHWNRNEKEDH